MGHITQTLRYHRQIHGRDPTNAEDNPGVIIRRLSETKLVRKNKETYTPPQNCQVRHIGAAQERYILDIIASVSLYAFNGTAKSTATKQSRNWDRWGTFLQHSGITDKSLE